MHDFAIGLKEYGKVWVQLTLHLEIDYNHMITRTWLQDKSVIVFCWVYCYLTSIKY